MLTSPEARLVLWTGGWDSSYRVLDLVLVRRQAVQPVYVADPGRRSSAKELATMKAITAAVGQRDSEAGKLLLPLEVFDRNEIEAATEITLAFDRLRTQNTLGVQYEWLARLAKQQGWTKLELAIHVDDRAFEVVREHVDGDDDGMTVRMDAKDTFTVFGRFRFPLLDMSKLDMHAAALATGFSDLMQLTWFCHQPDARGRPCGVCAPCRFTMAEGLAHRIPWQGHLRYLGHRGKDILKGLLRRPRPTGRP